MFVARPKPSPTPPSTVPPGPPIRSVPTAGTRVALTFDDGPNGQYTDAILATLARHRAPATFFVCGKPASDAAGAAQLLRMHRAGHAIGNHTYDHPRLTTLDDAETARQLRATSDVVERITGQRPTTYRPPGGHHDARVNAIAAAEGMRNVLWDIDTRDWSRPGADAIVHSAVNDARNGSIILLHDGGGNREQTVAALERIVTGLRARGFSLVTVPQLVAAARPA